jgi:hypothetical protein
MPKRETRYTLKSLCEPSFAVPNASRRCDVVYVAIPCRRKKRERKKRKKKKRICEIRPRARTSALEVEFSQDIMSTDDQAHNIVSQRLPVSETASGYGV